MIRQGQVALSSALLKASDVFFLFYLMEIYHHEATESSNRTALVQSTGWVCLTPQKSPPPSLRSWEWGRSLRARRQSEQSLAFKSVKTSLLSLVKLTLLRDQRCVWPQGLNKGGETSCAGTRRLAFTFKMCDNKFTSKGTRDDSPWIYLTPNILYNDSKFKEKLELYSITPSSGISITAGT